MARVTIEKALGIEDIESRFEYVVLASHRAHALSYGGRTAVRTNDKWAVIAMREIEMGLIDVDALRAAIITRYAREEQSPSSLNTFSSMDFAFDNEVADSPEATVKKGGASMDTMLFSDENE